VSIDKLLAYLDENDVAIELQDGNLVVQAEDHILEDDALISMLRHDKAALVELLKSGRGGWRGAKAWLPPNGIPQGATQITPQMLSLVQLSQAEIDQVVIAVPGGAANVQDIYPLAPLQQGILFHHLLDEEGGDTYIMPTLLKVDTEARMHAFLQALQQVIERHDILRSAVHWEGLGMPVQVVQRHAPLQVTELSEVAQLHALAEPQNMRMDLRHAPLIRVHRARDAAGAWQLLIWQHHLISDHVSLEITFAEIRALL
jgi:arthrofactin-type cyclic lipopeptide synthetase C